MDTELTVVVVLVMLAALAGAALLVVHGRRFRQEQQRMAAALLRKPDDLQLGADRPGGGWHGPSCSGGFPAVDPASREPVVPAQRTGDHDRRARTGRVLRRRG